MFHEIIVNETSYNATLNTFIHSDIFQYKPIA